MITFYIYRYYVYVHQCHVPKASKTNRSLYPDGFIWSCCDKEGTYASGCEGEDEDDEKKTNDY